MEKIAWGSKRRARNARSGSGTLANDGGNRNVKPSVSTAKSPLGVVVTAEPADGSATTDSVVHPAARTADTATTAIQITRRTSHAARSGELTRDGRST